MIDVARIDYWAASGAGPLHRASTVSKVLLLIMVVASAVIAKNPYPLAASCSVLIAAAASSGLPWIGMAALSIPAAVFALVYSVSLSGDAWVYALLILKAITPAYCVLILIVSTPYPKIFALLSSFLPEVVAAGLFMTYRSFFILLDMMDNFTAAIRLRGGFSAGKLIVNSANIGKAIGMMIILAVERASRLYAVMSVRGYSGSMAETETGGLRKYDWLPLGTGIAVLVMVIVWR